MRKTILTLAGSVAVSIVALTSVQGTAQAHEYRHHEIYYFHRDHDGRYHGWFSHYRYDRDHDRR